MKLIRADQRQFMFSLEQREKELLFQLLQLYPLVPPAHHQLSRENEASGHHEDQRLLDEALVEQRRDNRNNVAPLEEPGRFRKSKIKFSSR